MKRRGWILLDPSLGAMPKSDAGIGAGRSGRVVGSPSDGGVGWEGGIAVSLSRSQSLSFTHTQKRFGPVPLLRGHVDAQQRLPGLAGGEARARQRVRCVGHWSELAVFPFLCHAPMGSGFSPLLFSFQMGQEIKTGTGFLFRVCAAPGTWALTGAPRCRRNTNTK